MGRRSQEEEDNHWPGFVDALSTIVMVVTFLLIVLGIVIFGISQQIAKTILDAEITGKPPSEQQDNDVLQVDVNQVAKLRPETETAPKSAVQNTSKVGTDEIRESEKLTQETEVNSDNQLRIQSRKIVDEKRIVVATEEREQDTKKSAVEVRAAQQLLTIIFEGAGLELTETAESEIAAFLDENAAALAEQPLTAWGFFDQNESGVSQAKRKAYFRVLSVRNILISNGINGDKITVNIRPATTDEEIGQVRVFAR